MLIMAVHQAPSLTPEVAGSSPVAPVSRRSWLDRELAGWSGIVAPHGTSRRRPNSRTGTGPPTRLDASRSFRCVSLGPVACKLTSRKTGVDDDRYYKLHGDGKRLIHDWLARGRNTTDTYEAFIYLWIGFNAWAACVTKKDRDPEMIDALALDQDLNEVFADLLREDSRFA